jgi:AcrR family transcriptional regulator
VLDAVHRLLVGGASFTELGVQRIADEAGVARSSFYAHFADKTRVLLALARRLSVIAFGAHAEWTPGGQEAPPEFVDGFREILAHYRGHARILAAVLEVAGYDREVEEFWNEQIAMFRRRTRHQLEAERVAGRCSPTLDPDIAARIIVDGGMRIIAEQVVHGRAEDDDRVAREMSLTWWHGVYRRP